MALGRKRGIVLMGRKKGMVQIFDEAGHHVPCTVIQLEKNVVTQIKTEENDGYQALQLGYGEVVSKDEKQAAKRIGKPLVGHCKKSEKAPRKYFGESRLDSINGYELGQEIGVEVFKDVKCVDVAGTSKGKGFQGVMKLHNYSGGPASHGSKFHRERGSQGMRSTPGRCFKGGKRPSHMGNAKVTVQNLKIVKIDEENQLILLRGAVPGPINGLVKISNAVKAA